MLVTNGEKYYITRYTIKGSKFGDTVERCYNMRQCLEYLNKAFNSYRYTKIERERDTWTCYNENTIDHYTISRY